MDTILFLCAHNTVCAKSTSSAKVPYIQKAG